MLAERIGALGIATPKIQQIHGTAATIADARNPSEAIATILGWVDTYRTGRYELVWKNPFPGLDELAGVGVDPSCAPEAPYGQFRMVYDVPVPDGGWADESTFRRIDARIAAGAHDGVHVHGHTAPLGGFFHTIEDGIELRLYSGTTRHTYRLFRRSHDPDRTHTGWLSERSDAEQIAIIDRSRLHRLIVDESAAAIELGVPADLDASRFIAPGQLPRFDPFAVRRRAVEREVEQVKQQLKAAKRNARLAGDDEDAQVFVDEALALIKKERQLAKQLAELRADRPTPELAATFESDAGYLVFALGSLLRVDGAGPASLREALRTVVTDDTVAIDEDGTITFRWRLELPHAEGTVVLGPISGSLTRADDRRVGRKAQRSQRAPDRRALADELVALDLGRRAAEIAAACPHPHLVEALLAALREDPFPSSVDADWARWVVNVYTSTDFAWERHKWRIAYPNRQPILDAIRAAGGTELRDRLIEAGFADSQLRYLARELATPTGQSILQVDGRGRTRRYSLLPCPHCGGWASLSCVTPETRPGVLCPDCLRVPVTGSPVFPSWYADGGASG